MSAQLLAFPSGYRLEPEPPPPATTVDYGVWLLVNHFGRSEGGSSWIGFDAMVDHLTARSFPQDVAEDAALSWRVW